MAAPWALEHPSILLWLCHERKAPTSLHPGHAAGFCSLQATLKDEVTSPPDSEQAGLQFAVTAADSPAQGSSAVAQTHLSPSGLGAPPFLAPCGTWRAAGAQPNKTLRPLAVHTQVLRLCPKDLCLLLGNMKLFTRKQDKIPGPSQLSTDLWTKYSPQGEAGSAPSSDCGLTPIMPA